MVPMTVMEEAIAQDGPLDIEGSDEEVEPDSAEPIPLEERHQEAEPDEHHDVDILKHCKEEIIHDSWL